MTTKLTERLRGLPRYELTRNDSPDGRSYATPSGAFSSVTTILEGSRDNSGLAQWRESIGEERADFISSLACHRGTKHHEAIERFLTDGTEPEFCLLNTPYWKSTRSFLSRIEQPVLIEGAVWHPHGYAGTLDCIAYLPEDGVQPSLLDWKTANAKRKPDKVYEYSLQLAAYTAAANYVYASMGLNIQRAVLVIAIADAAPQIEEFDADALAQLYKHFQARLERFTYARSAKR